LLQRRNIIHVTHEADRKIGGIGTALEGILTADAYLDATERSIIIGPLFSRHAPADERLGPNADILYSSIDGLAEQPYARAFADIEKNFGVSIVYGKRTLTSPTTGRQAQPEIILVDLSHANLCPINVFKAWLYDDFGIPSNRYEHDLYYDQYVKLGPAAVAVLRCLGVSSAQHPAVILAHEHMAIPLALAAVMDPLGSFKTVFYAHEVAPVRRIVEDHPGHDLMFRNTIDWALDKNYYLDEVFGPQEFCFRNALVRAAANCDHVIGVSKNVLRELRFLGPQFDHAQLDLAYNGLSCPELSLDQKRSAKAKLTQYAQNLLGFRPDYIFTHVARMSTSKAFWRDLAVLHYLDEHFRQAGTSAVYFLLSTDAPQRPAELVRYMEKRWRWPLAHRRNPGDLTATEVTCYKNIRHFNAYHKNVKAVFVNQFGWEQQLCGGRMPGDMSFSDLRAGTDLELALSIYEPFGISALEPLHAGALCVTSSACGCNELTHLFTGERPPANLLIGDYTHFNNHFESGKPNPFLHIDQAFRDRAEHRVSCRLAQQIFQRLPQNDSQSESLLAAGSELARQMSWDNICQRYLLPALDHAYRRHRSRRTA